MRLSELVNTFKHRGREIFTFISHPDDIIRRVVRRRAQQMYEQAEIGGGERQKSQSQDSSISSKLPQFFRDQSQVETQIQPALKPRILQETAGVKTQIQPTVLDRPISTERSRRRRKDKTQKVLVQGYEIRDHFGRRYQIGQCIRPSSQIRQYEATPTAQQKQRVLIQEFLTRSPSDCLAEVTQQNGKVKEFRLLPPIDVIQDFYQDNPQDIRWYLIVNQIPKSLSLREYLNQRTQPLTPTQVSKVLQQILQTLQFLHNCYEVRLSDNIHKGMGHGNLSLDSLLIVPHATQSIPHEEDEELTIYVGRMALWEKLIDTLDAAIYHPCLSKTAVEKDLKDLGQISYFLSGGNQETPDQDTEWHQNCHPQIKNFTVQLYSGAFPTAKQAHQALIKLPLNHPVETPKEVVDEAENQVEVSRKDWIIPIIILLIALMSLGISFFGLWRFLSRSKPVESGKIAINKPLRVDQAEQVNIPSNLINQRINYVADSRWNIALKTSIGYGKNQSLSRQLNLLAPISFNSSASNSFSFSRTNNSEATEEQQKERLENTILSSLKKSQFIVTSLFNDEIKLLKNSDLLEIQIIAYDALFAYVAFSDVQRQGSLPNLLSGQISLDSLKQLYSNQPLTLKELGISNSSEQTVKRLLICHKNSEEIFLVPSLFENLVWKTSEETDNFINLINEDQKACSQTGYTKGTAKALAEFEQSGQAVIGIDVFAKIFNQCSVYPLAIVGEGKLTAVQPIIQNNGNPITPATDLCMDKGSYKPNPQVFEQGNYPLGYGIAVIYPKAGRKYSAGRVFSDLMKTNDGQHLLHSAGLIPIRVLTQNQEEF